MTQADIANQLAAGNLVLRQHPARAIVRLGVRIMLAAAFGIPAVHDRTWWVVVGWLGCIGFGCLGLITAIAAFRGVPVVQASQAGIWLTSEGGGRTFVSWPDIVEFNEYDSILAIRLREGAKPFRSAWARISDAGWGPRTALVPLWVTAESPSEIANALRVLRSRYLAA